MMKDFRMPPGGRRAGSHRVPDGPDVPQGASVRPKRRHSIRRVVDVALAAALVLVMSTPLAEEAAHEWLGIAVAVLSVAHVALNARALSGLLRSGPLPLRIVLVLADLALVACLATLAASSLVLSVHAFSWLPVIPGAAWARPAHMLCSFWLFALSAFHLGLHLPRRTRRPTARVIGTILAVVAVVGGAASFAWLDLGAYLAGGVPFYAVDTSQPLIVRAGAYVLAGALIVVVGSTVRRFLAFLGSRACRRSARSPRRRAFGSDT